MNDKIWSASVLSSAAEILITITKRMGGRGGEIGMPTRIEFMIHERMDRQEFVTDQNEIVSQMHA